MFALLKWLCLCVRVRRVCRDYRPFYICGNSNQWLSFSGNFHHALYSCLPRDCHLLQTPSHFPSRYSSSPPSSLLLPTLYCFLFMSSVLPDVNILSFFYHFIGFFFFFFTPTLSLILFYFFLLSRLFSLSPSLLTFNYFFSFIVSYFFVCLLVYLFRFFLLFFFYYCLYQLFSSPPRAVS